MLSGLKSNFLWLVLVAQLVSNPQLVLLKSPLRESLFREHPFREHPFRVLIFWDVDCPICQKTTRRVQQLADQYQNRVQFEAVYPTPTTTITEVRAFEEEYKVTFSHRLDPKHQLVNRYDVTTTPEVLLLSRQGKLIYRGSVDNQFYRLGRSRPAPTEFYLKNAIEAMLAGQPVSVTQTTPTGCLITRK